LLKPQQEGFQRWLSGGVPHKDTLFLKIGRRTGIAAEDNNKVEGFGRRDGRIK